MYTEKDKEISQAVAANADQVSRKLSPSNKLQTRSN